jgi:CHAD domain-containing protein
VEALRGWLAAAADGATPEATHQIRVETRRIDVWLRLAGRRALRDDLRALRRAAGPVRDLDVLGHGERAAAEDALLAAVRAERTRSLLLALDVLPPLDPDGAAPRLRHLVHHACRLPDASALDLHRIRRAIRRIRYAREWLDQDPGPLPALQEALGAATDALTAAAGDPAGVPRRSLDAARDAWAAARPALERWS